MRIIDLQSFLLRPAPPRGGWKVSKHLLLVRVDTDEGIVGWGEAFTLGDREQNVDLSQRRALAVVRFLQDAGIDLLISLVGSFTWDNMPVRVAQELNVPIILWGVPEPPMHGGRLEANSLVGVTMNAAALKRMGNQYKFVYGLPDDPAAIEEIERTVRVIAAIKRLRHTRLGIHRHTQTLAQNLQLIHGGRTINIGCHEQRLAFLFEQIGCEFAGGGGLTRALQADDHPDRRRAGSEKRLGVFAEQVGEFIANDFDDLLIGGELQHDFAAEGSKADAGEKFINDREGDIAIEHRFANFGERGVQVFFGEFALAAKVFESALQLFGEVFKHGGSS